MKKLNILGFLLIFYTIIVESAVAKLSVSGNPPSPDAVIRPLTQLNSQADVVTILTIHGSNTVGARLGPELAVSYLKAKGLKRVVIEQTEVKNETVIKGVLPNNGQMAQIRIEAHGSSTGFKGLQTGEADIWASSRPVKRQELDVVKGVSDLLNSRSEHILAIDGLAIIVHPSNPLSNLSTTQLGQLFSGQIRNWSQLGGDNQPVSLYARDSNSGTWDSFKSMVLGKQYSLSPLARRFESSSLLSDLVSKDRGGIGFIGMAFVGGSKLVAISDGPTQALKPTNLTIATEDYALSRRLYMYTHTNPTNEFVKEFIAYSGGITGQNVVNQSGFISQNVDAMITQITEDLPDDYVALVDGAKRLNVNFRFNVGSAELDNKAKKDIQRLVHFLSREKGNKDVILIGFGDRRKNEARSKLLSKLRAMAVRRELVKNGIYPKETKGYGDYNPVASFEGGSRVKNRRVEVWVR